MQQSQYFDITPYTYKLDKNYPIILAWLLVIYFVINLALNGFSVMCLGQVLELTLYSTGHWLTDWLTQIMRYFPMSDFLNLQLERLFFALNLKNDDQIFVFKLTLTTNPCITPFPYITIMIKLVYLTTLFFDPFNCIEQILFIKQLLVYVHFEWKVVGCMWGGVGVSQGAGGGGFGTRVLSWVAQYIWQR